MQVILENIKTVVDHLALKINAPRHLMPGYGHSTRKDQVYIKVDKHGQLCYVIDDGAGKREYPSPDINDLLYMVLRHIASSMAIEYVENNVIEKKDYRRQYFSKQLELLSMLSKDWRDRAEQEHQAILKFET